MTTEAVKTAGVLMVSKKDFEVFMVVFEPKDGIGADFTVIGAPSSEYGGQRRV